MENGQSTTTPTKLGLPLLTPNQQEALQKVCAGVTVGVRTGTVLSLRFAVSNVIGCPILPAGQEVRHGAKHQECSGETDSCPATANQFTGNCPPVVAAVRHFLLLIVDCVCPLDGAAVNGPR